MLSTPHPGSGSTTQSSRRTRPSTPRVRLCFRSCTAHRAGLYIPETGRLVEPGGSPAAGAGHAPAGRRSQPCAWGPGAARPGQRSAESCLRGGGKAENFHPTATAKNTLMPCELMLFLGGSSSARRKMTRWRIPKGGHAPTHKEQTVVQLLRVAGVMRWSTVPREKQGAGAPPWFAGKGAAGEEGGGGGGGPSGWKDSHSRPVPGIGAPVMCG